MTETAPKHDSPRAARGDDAGVGTPPALAAYAWRRATQVLAGMGRGARRWPGMWVPVLAYAVTVILLRASAHSQLVGLVAALVCGVAWYASPARDWEARRRASHRPGR